MRQQTDFESKALTQAIYDDDTRRLTLEFRDGTIGEYDQVPPEIHAALLSARSKGQYLNATIRGCFACKPISCPRKPTFPLLS